MRCCYTFHPLLLPASNSRETSSRHEPHARTEPTRYIHYMRCCSFTFHSLSTFHQSSSNHPTASAPLCCWAVCCYALRVLCVCVFTLIQPTTTSYPAIQPIHTIHTRLLLLGGSVVCMSCGCVVFFLVFCFLLLYE